MKKHWKKHIAASGLPVLMMAHSQGCPVGSKADPKAGCTLWRLLASVFFVLLLLFLLWHCRTTPWEPATNKAFYLFLCMFTVLSLLKLHKQASANRASACYCAAQDKSQLCRPMQISHNQFATPHKKTPQTPYTEFHAVPESSDFQHLIRPLISIVKQHYSSVMNPATKSPLHLSS